MIEKDHRKQSVVEPHDCSKRAFLSRLFPEPGLRTDQNSNEPIMHIMTPEQVASLAYPEDVDDQDDNNDQGEHILYFMEEAMTTNKQIKPDTVITLEYRKHESGFVFIEDSTPLRKFYNSMAKTKEDLIKALVKDFPGQSFELRLAE